LKPLKPKNKENEIDKNSNGYNEKSNLNSNRIENSESERTDRTKHSNQDSSELNIKLPSKPKLVRYSRNKEIKVSN